MTDAHRYFYDCPIKAALMVRYHGMEVTRTHCHREDGTFGESTRPVPIWILARDVENQVSEKVRYYVHADSLDFLEPQVGDVVTFNYKGRGEYGVYLIPDQENRQCHLPGGRHSDNKIIQRNGIAFHWPEREPV